jgi:solute carrier family 35 (adenosine 3'-phospho 5'-phosphosulfate transporter), member B2
MNSQNEYFNLLNSLVSNTFQYIEIWLPLLIIYKLIRQFFKEDNSKKYGLLGKLAKLYAYGSERAELPSLIQTIHSSDFTPIQNIVCFTICFIGLQLSFLTWGLMQERIIKFEYQTIDDQQQQVAKFKNAQFLVLCNRFCGFLLSLFLLILCNLNKSYRSLSTFKKLGSIKDLAPLFICSYSSLSNVFSSWFQYEALKYVSFTTQLLAKSSKSVFVMIVGRLIGNRKYNLVEYLAVGTITFGLYLFSDIEDTLNKSKDLILSTTFPGILCLLGYLISDSFTSTWQDKVLKKHSMSSISLMCITNVFSTIFTFFSLFNGTGLKESIRFAIDYPQFRNHVILLSLAASIGQVFIFVTIEKYGALVFTLIMTTRQVFSIILSCLFFNHKMGMRNMIGTFIIFTALFIQQIPKLFSSRNNNIKKQREQEKP